MRNLKRLRPSPAMVVASIALFVAIGGISWAAATIGTNDIKNGAVTKNKLHRKAVTSGKIKGQAVKTGKIKKLAVKTGRIANQAVTTDKLADLAVTTNKLADLAVTTNKLADLAVTTNKLADSAVNGDKVQDDSLTGSEIDELTLGTVPSATNSEQLGGVAASEYAQRLFARVQYNDPTPSIIASSPGVTANGEGALGFPRVIFPRSVDGCAVVGGASSNAGTQIVRRSTNVTGAQVQMAIRNENGSPVRSNFDLIAIC